MWILALKGLRGTYSTTTNYITGTADFNSNKENYVAVS